MASAAITSSNSPLLFIRGWNWRITFKRALLSTVSFPVTSSEEAAYNFHSVIAAVDCRCRLDFEKKNALVVPLCQRSFRNYGGIKDHSYLAANLSAFPVLLATGLF
ncbi:hypothetical protein Y032_0272g912 [Ancylostoma ceylanicum]|uniref:Uncharacterized protein n=1 Tax=Ancylostoma ceylanicum TaxID=53326 RepID=A0A016S812_9BILA|nr:hypothetical protein Y032_0272g912 [Ancylostoma ceylanicum]